MPDKTVAVQMNGDKFQLTPRLGGDLGDHQLHEYFQSLGADRRRSFGQESRRERFDEQTLGENQLGAGLESRHGIFKGQRLAALFGKDRFSHRRLRLHDLYR